MITAAITANRASLIITIAVWKPLAPSDRAVSMMLRSTPLSAEMVRPSNIGVMRSICPSTMTVGVNMRPSPPSGPVRENMTKTKSPTATVGTL